MIDRVHQFGSGLICKGLTAANDTFVGIYASNRPEVRSLLLALCIYIDLLFKEIYNCVEITVKWTVNKSIQDYANGQLKGAEKAVQMGSPQEYRRLCM